jgi:hypothetical protein
MHLREVVITSFIASAVAREWIGDPTTMPAHSAVEVEAARTMGAHGTRFKSMFIGVESTASTITWLLFPKAALASRQRRLSLRAVQTHRGIEGDVEGGRRYRKVKPPGDNER